MLGKWQIELFQNALADKEEVMVMLKETIAIRHSQILHRTSAYSRLCPQRRALLHSGRLPSDSLAMLGFADGQERQGPLDPFYLDTNFESQHLGHNIVPESRVESSSAFLPSDSVPNEVLKTPTYADMVASPVKPRLILLRRSSPPSKVPDSRDLPSSPPVALALVYFTAINVTKLSTFRQNNKARKLDLVPLGNISFVGVAIAELLVETSDKK
jgi:hypothetical protein